MSDDSQEPSRRRAVDHAPLDAPDPTASSDVPTVLGALLIMVMV